MNYLLVLSVFTQCMITNVQKLSGLEITKKGHVKCRPASKKQVTRLVKMWEKHSSEKDVRLLSLAWMESRLRPYTKRGDRGKACGVFQIHARHSYPLFRRKGGYKDWDEKSSRREIALECAKLERLEYSIETMNRLIKLLDQKDKHICHHNSGIYAKCNPWYKYRLDYINQQLEQSKALCEKEHDMAMIRTGNPVSVAPTEKVQGYLDFMAGKDPAKDDEVYMSGYKLAEQVKKGEAEAPVWAK